MAGLNYYDVLGISSVAETREIKRAYRRLASQYHPDKVGSLPPKLREMANEEMRRINTAKEVLLDRRKRAEHDGELKKRKVDGDKQRMRDDKTGTFACPHCSNRVSAVQGEKPYVMICPRCRKQMTIPIRKVSSPRDDRLDIYKEAMRRALMDGVITRDESFILDGLREVLKVSPVEHQNIMFQFRR